MCTHCCTQCEGVRFVSYADLCVSRSDLIPRRKDDHLIKHPASAKSMIESAVAQKLAAELKAHMH